MKYTYADLDNANALWLAADLAWGKALKKAFGKLATDVRYNVNYEDLQGMTPALILAKTHFLACGAEYRKILEYLTVNNVRR